MTIVPTATRPAKSTARAHGDSGHHHCGGAMRRTSPVITAAGSISGSLIERTMRSPPMRAGAPMTTLPPSISTAPSVRALKVTSAPPTLTGPAMCPPTLRLAAPPWKLPAMSDPGPMVSVAPPARRSPPTTALMVRTAPPALRSRPAFPLT